MTARRWNIVVAVAVVVIGALVAVTATDPPSSTFVALGILAAFAVFYFAVGRRGLLERRWALPLAIAVILATAVGTAFSPNMATLQAIAFPLIWILGPDDRMRPAVLGCLVLGLGTGLGFYVALGGGLDALMHAVVIEGVSLAIGLGIGIWFTIEARKGDEYARMLAELTAVQGELAALHREAGAVDERERLARDLHDTIAQSLTSVVMLAQRAQNRGDDTGAVHDDLAMIEEVARDALTETRALVAASAGVAVDGGLVHALERLVARFERETRIDIATRFDEVGAVPRDHEVVLLRCAQEALANVRKHSEARSARLELRRAGDAITLSVRDDGLGIGDAPWPESGFGLEGMRQRLGLVGGTLEVTAPGGGGTELVVVITVGADDSGSDGNGAGGGAGPVHDAVRVATSVEGTEPGEVRG